MQITESPRHPYLLYALTISGVAYLLKLRDIYTYASGFVFLLDELLEFNIQAYSNHGAITTVTATAGCLVVGFNDGSVSCFQLGFLDQSAPGINNISRPHLCVCIFCYYVFFLLCFYLFDLFLLNASHTCLLDDWLDMIFILCSAKIAIICGLL